MHNCCKEGGFVGEICESLRFMSPTWETLSKWEIGPKRGSLPPKVGGLTGMIDIVHTCMKKDTEFFNSFTISAHLIIHK